MNLDEAVKWVRQNPNRRAIVVHNQPMLKRLVVEYGLTEEQVIEVSELAESPFLMRFNREFFVLSPQECLKMFLPHKINLVSHTSEFAH